MKIAFVTGDDPTRDARIRQQTEALVVAQHRVTVYGVHSPGTEHEEERSGVVHVRAEVKGWRSRGGRLSGPMRVARWYERFAPVAELAASRERPEAVHACGLDVALPAQDVALALGAPFVLDVAGAAYVDRLDAASAPRAALAHLRRAGAAAERRIRRRGVAAVVADSDALAADLASRYGAPRPVVVRTCPPFAAPKRTDALRRRVDAGPKDRLLLFFAPLDESSGIDAAVRALKLLGTRHVLVVFGRATDASRVARIAEDEGVAAMVRFVAPAADAESERLAASADVALVPTLPRTPVDHLGVAPRFYSALAAGLPVVASDTREVGAIVRRTGAGVLYTARCPQDPAALAEGVHTVLEDRALAAACAEAAVRAAREEFNRAKQSARLVDVYDAVEETR